MKKLVLGTILCVSMFFCAFSADAQTVTRSNEFSFFNKIEASYNYKIIVKEGSYNRVEWTVDTILAELVDIYQQGSTLYVKFKEKDLTKEIKKHYKGKNAPVPTLDVVVFTPSLDGLDISDNVLVEATDLKTSDQNLSVVMRNNSRLNNLKTEASNITLEASGEAVLNVSAQSTSSCITVKGDKKSEINLNLNSEKLYATASGSADIYITGNAAHIEASLEDKSKMVLRSGSAEDLLLTSKNSSELDASSYIIGNAGLSMAGSKAIVKVNKILKLNLKGGSVVNYLDNPAIEIVNIEKSSVSPLIK